MNLDDLMVMMSDDTYYATCKNCGHEQQVEPDADYPCPECRKGHLMSPLIKMGVI